MARLHPAFSPFGLLVYLIAPRHFDSFAAADLTVRPVRCAASELVVVLVFEQDSALRMNHQGWTTMYAGVLHAIGSAPRREEFPEPVVSDNDGEAIVHVHGASLKPVDKQLVGGSHYANRRELPSVCGSDGVGHLNEAQRMFMMLYVTHV